MENDFGEKMSKGKKGPSKPRKVRLMVIPKPDPKERAIIDPKFEDDSTVMFRGPEVHASPMVCGGCGATLVVGMNRGELQAVVLHCPACGAYNDTP